MSQTIVIVGGGIMGLSIAYELAMQGGGRDDIFLLEREENLGHHTSTRNSEVIHAGFAYPPDSLKAKLCVEGNRLSFELFDKLGVRYRREGKWVVAHSDEDVRAISEVIENAKACGVAGMREASPSEVVKAVPEAALPKAAAFAPISGIADVAGYIKNLETALTQMPGVYIVYPCEVKGVDVSASKVVTDRDEMDFDILINSAGLFADDVYKMCGGRRRFEIRPYKGEYYTWRKGTISGLVYPVPSRFLHKGDATKVSGMGIHLHRSVAGELFLGPSQVVCDPSAKMDYTIVTEPETFAKAVVPLLRTPPPVNELEPAFAGNRPKLFEDGNALADFVFAREDRFVHLMGIESPGLTAAPAIARHVIQMLK